MMKDIPLNQETIDILNEALWFIKDDNYKLVHCGKKDLRTPEKADYYCGEEYYKKIRSMGRSHDGFPEILVGYSFGLGNTSFTSDAYDKIPVVTDIQEAFLKNIQTQFMLKRNALFSVYPPNGYISWHNNANASAFNFIFTYSEHGDGYWQHWDMEQKCFVRIHDVKGWQCKAGYFGAYADGEEKLVYHTARNGDKGLRMTIAFVLDRSELSEGMQEWVIEDIHE